MSYLDINVRAHNLFHRTFVSTRLSSFHRSDTFGRAPLESKIGNKNKSKFESLLINLNKIP